MAARGCLKPDGAHAGLYMPFQEVERIEFRHYYDPIQMARSFRAVQRDVRRLIESHSGLYFEREVSDKDGRTRRYRIPVLPRAGPKWFIIENYTPEGGEVPVELLFKMKDLYLMGFFGEGKLHLFQDADKSGMSSSYIRDYVQILSFRGSYKDIGQDFKSLVIGLNGQLDTYAVLSRFGKKTDVEYLSYKKHYVM